MAEDDGTTLNGDVNISGDTSKARKEVESLKEELEKLTSSINDAGKAFDSAFKNISNISKSSESLKNVFSDTQYQTSFGNYRSTPTGAILKNYAQATKTNAVAYKTSAQAELQYAQNDAALEAEKKALLSAMKKHTDAETKYTELLTKNRTEQGNNRNSFYSGYSISRIGRQVEYGSSSSVMRMAGAGLEILGNTMINPFLGVVTAAQKLGNAFNNLATESLKDYGEVQQLQTSLGVVYGNQSQANTAFQGISGYAIKSPFNVEQTEQMAVLLRQSGVYSSDLMNTLKMIGDTAGGNATKMTRIATNYAQVVATGRASMLDMRQFAYAGIPIFAEVAKQMGVSQSALRGMVTDGKVTGEVIEQVFKNMTSEGGQFYGAVEKGSKILNSQLSNLKDARQLMMSAFGESFYKTGSKYGNDSIGARVIDFATEVTKGLYNWKTGQNIEAEVKRINNTEKEIANLKDMLEKYGKDDPVLSQYINAQITKLQNIRTPDETRASRTADYKIFEGRNQLAQTNAQTKKIIDKESENYINLIQKRNKLNDTINSFGSKAPDEFNNKLKELNGQIEATKQALESFGVTVTSSGVRKPNLNTDTTTIPWELTAADAQSRMLDMISAAGDSMSKIISKNTSGISVAGQIVQQYESSNTYKALKKAEDEKSFKEVQTFETLLSSAYDKTSDYFDTAKLSVENYKKAIEKGYLSWDSLDLTLDKDNPSQFSENLSILGNNLVSTMKVINDASKGVSGISDTSLSSVKAAITGIQKKGYVTTPENQAQFVASATKNAKISIETELSKAIQANDKQLIKFWETVQKYLGFAFLKFTPDLSAINVPLNPDQDNTPLWKYVVHGATNLPVTAMTSKNMGGLAENPYNVMMKYQDFQARDIVQSVITGMTTSGRSQSDITKNFKYVTNNGNVTEQIDWKATEKAMSDFIYSQSSTTKELNAYKQAVSKAVDVYRKLEQTMYTADYSDYIKGKKQASYTEMASLIQNAYIGGITAKPTAEYLKTNPKATEIPVYAKEGKYYEQGTNKEITNVENYTYGLENLARAIEEVLPVRISELAKITTESYRTRQIQSGSQQILGNMLTSGVAPSSQQNVLSGLINTAISNPEVLGSLQSEFEAAIAHGNITSAADGTKSAIDVLKEYIKVNKETIDTLTKISDKIKGSAGAKTVSELNLPVSKEGQSLSNKLFGTYGTNDVQQQSVMDKLGLKDTNYSDVLKETQENLKEAGKAYDEFHAKQSIGWAADTKVLQEFNTQTKSMVESFAVDTLTSSFSTLGKALQDGDNVSEALADNFQSLASSMLGQFGKIAATAGAEIIAMNPSNMGAWALGLSLMALGGFTSFASGYLSNSSSTTEDQTQKLETLKEDLLDIMAQAKEDAAYYESELKHQNALSTNETVSSSTYTKVNDAIITKRGDIVQTAPDDYIMAMKNPASLASSNNSSPNVNISFVNNSGDKVAVTQSKTTQSGNNIDIQAVIEAVTANYISSSKSDMAFNARASRVNGRSVSS
ncbi:MAG: tape measure protein [Clostridia bacterium]|jgi:tape measure domain-containing protein|nr:tape measure protein [Clostridia bacterium]